MTAPPFEASKMTVSTPLGRGASAIFLAPQGCSLSFGAQATGGSTSEALGQGVA